MGAYPFKNKQEELKRIKKCIENSFEYDRENFQRFNSTRKFVFKSNMTETERQYNETLNRPSLEFPVLNAYVSRLRGEFSKNMPSFCVSGKDGKKADPVMIRVIEDHLNYIMSEANKKGFEYDVYTDTLTGGMGAGKVLTKYTGEMSFNQDIFIQKTFDTTMTFFDPMAKECSRVDGRYSGEVYPMTWEDFKIQFPGKDKDEFKFVDGSMKSSLDSDSISGFEWSYSTQNEDVVIVADFYAKKKKRKKIVMLTDGTVKTMEQYKKYLSDWELEGFIEQPAQIVGKPRMTEITEVVRYIICENDILDYTETPYSNLPIVFFDGDTIVIRENENGYAKKFTRPIVYQAIGAQKLKNYAGQSLANELQNMVQHKWRAPIEGIPEEYKQAYVEPQLPMVMVYNQFKDGDQNVRLDPPEAIIRAPIPPEIMNTIQASDQIIQNILGSFDQNIPKMGEREVSGKAIQETLSLSNASSMPYVVGFLRGLQAIADTILNLIPKVYVTPRSIPVITPEGKREYVLINQEGGVSLDYDQDTFQVEVKAGPSFGIQQQKALQSIFELMKANPMFAAFMNENGLNELLDNMDFRGIEQLKEKADAWMRQMQQARQKQSQAPNPEQIKIQIEQQKLQLQQQEMQAKMQQAEKENQVKMLQMQLEIEKLEIQKAEILASIENQQSNAMVQLEKSHTERISKAAELMIKKEALDSKKLEAKEKEE